MAINIIRAGTKVFKVLNGVEIEIFGDEKAFYVKEMQRIDDGEVDRGTRVRDERVVH